MLPRDERLLADLRALRRVMDAVLRSAEAAAVQRVPRATCDGCAEPVPVPSLDRCAGCGRTLCFGCRADCAGLCAPVRWVDDFDG